MFLGNRFLTAITTKEGSLMAHPFACVDDPETFLTSNEEFENEIVPK